MKEEEIIRIPKRKVLGFDVRYTLPEDALVLREWFEEKEIWPWFPISNELELEDSIQRWIGFYRCGSSLTGMFNGEPCSIGTFYPNPYKKIAHQCLLTLIVSKKARNLGIGTQMLRNMIHLAKSKFRIEVLHLEVYEGNPAIRLYERCGFKEFGFQKRWVKMKDGTYIGRICMELYLDQVELN